MKRIKRSGLLPYVLGISLATAALTNPVLADDDEDDLDDDILLLSPFEVESSSNVGYLATQTLAGTRIKTDLKDVGSAISVVTKEMLRDTGATDNQTLLAYTTNTEVGGTTGNFSGFVGDDSDLDETASLINPNQNTRVRGLTSADNTRDYFLTNVPWDGYNTERVDMQRGPNAMLFGIGSPAGIINSSSNQAYFWDSRGNVSLRFDRWGGSRASFDHNQVILEDELAVRVDILKDNKRYRQQQAYANDQRLYIASRYAPKFLNTDNVSTQLRVNYEHGEVDANRPRTLTPADLLTAWWDELDQEGIDTTTANDEGGFLDVDGGNYEAWFGGLYANAYGGVIITTDNGSDTSTAQAAKPYGVNGLGDDGEVDGGIGGLSGMYNAPSIASLTTYADLMELPGYDFGAYKTPTITDSSIYDFYNNLLDGSLKWESQDWDTHNINFSQNFFGNRFGYEMSYNKQKYSQAQESLLSSWCEGLCIDVRTVLYDGSENPNYGRVYVANRGQYGNSSSDVERENFRFTVTAELYGSDFFEEGSMLAHIIGRHVFTGLYSNAKTNTDSRGWKLYGIADEDWNYITGTDDATGNDLNLNYVIYLTESLADVDSYEGLYISPVSSITAPSTLEVTYFDNTWNGAATGVDYADGWDSNGDGEEDSTQSENPDNYVGWTTDTFDYISSDTDRDSLYTSGKLVQNIVESKSFAWQGYLFDGLVVPAFGYREDTSETWSYTATSDDNIKRDDNTLDLSSNLYVIPNESDLAGADDFDDDDPRSHTIDRGNSKSYSLVVHSPDFINKHLPWGLEISGFYNKSENFQPIAGRINFLGEDLVSPSGDTTDYGFVISALDNRVSLKVNWYETLVENASMSGGLGALSNAVWAIGGLEARAGYYARIYYYSMLADRDAWTWDWSVSNGAYAYDYTVYNADGSIDTDATVAATEAAELESLQAWFANEVSDQFKSVWSIDYNVDESTGIATSSAADVTTPTGLAATCDQTSKGIEFELYLRPTDNWSITMNASKTKARRFNMGASLEEWILARDEVMQGSAGDIRNWWIGGSTTIRDSWNATIMSNYQLFKQLEDADSPELRPWRANIITNYNFSEGALKGFSIGGGYRWQDKSIIGYYIADYDDDGNWSYDLDSPYYGKSTSAFDLWFAYSRSLTEWLDWRVQINIRNVFGKKELIPLNTTPTLEDPTQLEVASWAIAEDMSFSITNTFTF